MPVLAVAGEAVAAVVLTQTLFLVFPIAILAAVLVLPVVILLLSLRTRTHFVVFILLVLP